VKNITQKNCIKFTTDLHAMKHDAKVE